MEHRENKFNSAEQLTEFLVKTAVHREYRARLVMEYGQEHSKIQLMTEILDQLQKPWRHQGEETEWRAELVLEHQEFLEEHGILPMKSKKIEVPLVSQEEKEALANPAPAKKKPKKPAKK